MKYEENISRLKKLVTYLKKEESEVKNENEKCENEISEIRKSAQDKITKILSAKKKKLKTKETKISELQNEKMQILGSIFMMFSQGKITKDELDKAGKIESDLDMLEDKSNSKKQTDEATQPNNNSDENKDSNQ